MASRCQQMCVDADCLADLLHGVRADKWVSSNRHRRVCMVNMVGVVSVAWHLWQDKCLMHIDLDILVVHVRVYEWLELADVARLNWQPVRLNHNITSYDAHSAPTENRMMGLRIMPCPTPLAQQSGCKGMHALPQVMHAHLHAMPTKQDAGASNHLTMVYRGIGVQAGWAAWARRSGACVHFR